jgi:hypothetical protein
MTGAHRRPTQRPVVPKARVIVALALLALAAVCIYLAIAEPAVALYAVAGFQGTLLIFVFGDVAWSLLRKPPRAPGQRVRLFRRVLLPVGSTIFCLSIIGQQRGWLHDGAELALIWTACAINIGAAVWIVGERRLMAALRARAAAKSE